MVGGLVLKPLFGNTVIEKVFFYLFVYGSAYAKRLASVYKIPVNGIQQQLRRLEDGGILISRDLGRVRMYEFNPRYPFLKEVKQLLAKAMEFLPKEEIEQYYRERTRPRRPGKPIK
jgi:hypothetical protein